MSIAFDPHDEEIWRGGYYEAALVLGARNAPVSDAILGTAIRRLWAHRGLRAAALGDLDTWTAMGEVDLVSPALEKLHRIYGAYDSPALGMLPFTSVVVREDDGADWLYGSIPLGGIPKSGSYPFDEPNPLSRGWREPLERELAAMTLDISLTVSMRHAAIGFEIAGDVRIEAGMLSESGSRWVGYVARDGDGYRYWPTNRWA